MEHHATGLFEYHDLDMSREVLRYNECVFLQDIGQYKIGQTVPLIEFNCHKFTLNVITKNRNVDYTIQLGVKAAHTAITMLKKLDKIAKMERLKTQFLSDSYLSIVPSGFGQYFRATVHAKAEASRLNTTSTG